MKRKEELDDLLHDFVGDEFRNMQFKPFEESVQFIVNEVQSKLGGIIANHYRDYIAEYIRERAIYELSFDKYCEDGFYDESQWTIFDGLGLSVDDVLPAKIVDQRAEIMHGKIIGRAKIITHNPLNGGYQ